MDLASWEKRMKILIGTRDWNPGKCICKENLRKISRESQSWTDVRRWSLYFSKGLKHRHRRNVTSHHFTSFLFTSMSMYFRHTSWQIWYTLKPMLYKKFNQILIFLSHILTNLRYSETKAIQKVQVQVYISWKFGQQVAPFAFVENLATRWRHLY